MLPRDPTHILAWIIWLLTTLALSTYVGACRPSSTTLELTPGRVVEFTVLRLTAERLTLFAAFGDGSGSSSSETDLRSQLREQFRIFASAASDSVTYAGSLPYGRSGLMLGLHPVDPPALSLHPGLNLVRLEVQAVDPALLGETIKLWIPSPVNNEPSHYGLGEILLYAPLLLWPVFLIMQAGWALSLLFLTFHDTADAHEETPASDSEATS